MASHSQRKLLSCMVKKQRQNVAYPQSYPQYFFLKRVTDPPSYWVGCCGPAEQLCAGSASTWPAPEPAGRPASRPAECDAGQRAKAPVALTTNATTPLFSYLVRQTVSLRPDPAGV